LGRPTKSAPSHPDQSRPRRVWVEHFADRLIPRGLQRYREQLLYLCIGAWNTLLGYGVFVVLYYFLHGTASDTVIIVTSYVVSIANAYLGYRYVVFRSHGRVLYELPRFSIVYVATMLVNLIFFPIALETLPVSAYLVQAVFTVGVVVASYVGHRYFSFGGRSGVHGGRHSHEDGASDETAERH
jgi:putative flippase GtrA